MSAETTQPRRRRWIRFLAGVAVMHVVGVVLAALFSRTVPGSVWPRTPRALEPPLHHRPAALVECPRCGLRVPAGSSTCPRCGWPASTGTALAPGPPFQQVAYAAPGPPVALGGGGIAAPTGTPAPGSSAATAAAAAIAGWPATAGLAAPATAGLAAPATVGSTGAGSVLPGPREQNAAGKEFIEGHWLGLEVIPLTPELAKEYQIPAGENGVLVDEITLEAAESGILAGDMVHAVAGQSTPDLKQFLRATLAVRLQPAAEVEVGRRGRRLVFTLTSRNTPELGAAQMEAAQPIAPGALSPHRSRGKPCTTCHVIMETGGQLPTDAGDIVARPPAIGPGAVAPHRYRGSCGICHAQKP